MTRIKAVVFACFATLAFACSDGGGDNDAGPDVIVTTDGGPQESGTDATLDSTVDAPQEADATIVDSDASDAPVFTNPTSEQIEIVRLAAGTTTDGGALNLPIDDAIVTYTKSLVGTDPAGFFVQAEQTGPAIFVAVDPQTLSPVPVPGDKVSFTVTGATVTSGLHMVTSLTGFTRTAQNISLATLLRDVSSATDLVSNIDSYESEYVTLALDVKTTFTPVGTGFVQAQIETTALTGNAALNLRLRTPTTVRTSLAVDANCSMTLTGIMWRLGGVAQPSGWISGDVTSLVCPAPKVKSAMATADTSVLVTFDRDIDGTTLASDGSQFAFDNGLTASAAVLATSKQVSVTTSTQAKNTKYNVTVDSTLLDLLAKGIDSTANSAGFSSFSTVATLQLNEIQPNGSCSADMIELLVVNGGNVNGITIEQDVVSKTTLATLPNLTVATGDFVVVHVGAVTATTETSSKGDCSDASCYSGAWDIAGGSTGITYSGRVLVVRDPSANILDAASFYTATPPSAFYQNVMALQTAGAWLPATCSGSPCNSNTLAEGVSVVWTGCNATNSVARKTNADTGYAADWAVGTSSFGATNP